MHLRRFDGFALCRRAIERCIVEGFILRGGKGFARSAITTTMPTATATATPLLGRFIG
jgi:hypothetical protein